MTEPVRLVENRYRAGVVARRLAAEAEEDVLSTMLDGVQAIFEAPAWVSRRAGQVIEELSDLRWDAKAAALEV
ncbi:MAG: hypothetical protein LBL55_05705, partial [Propionibacteriaceae bacterium]|nr:hypothetical protein [Propionibacteriaceae bacterium]